jgi:predicted enzyme related to lactoylglutathione lyase
MNHFYFRPLSTLVAGALTLAGLLLSTGDDDPESSPSTSSMHFADRSAGPWSSRSDTASSPIERLGWMAGYWEGDHEGITMEEVWLEPRGGVMLGQHRDTRDGKKAFFEYLRIEERPDGLAYLASPGGRPPIEFRSIRQSDSLVVFANPNHDYPQQIRYWLDQNGALHARVGGMDAIMPSTEWVWTRRSVHRDVPEDGIADLRSIRTVAYTVPDLESAKAWYAAAFDAEPYFDEPFYVGFQIGDVELGLDPDTSTTDPGVGGAVAYWGVANAQSAFDRLVQMGAGVISKPTNVGGGVVVATVSDPFGNPIGIIESR